jgi:hypothetical protein
VSVLGRQRPDDVRWLADWLLRRHDQQAAAGAVEVEDLIRPAHRNSLSLALSRCRFLDAPDLVLSLSH